MDFKQTKKEAKEIIVKKNFSTEYFFVNYEKLLANPSALENTKKMDIEHNKKLGYNYLDSSNIDKINIIPGFKTGMQDMVTKIQQGVGLIFVSECYEPFRVFDTEQEQEAFVEKQKNNKISDSEIKDFLVKGGYYQDGRHFLDDWGHVQHIDGNMKIAERTDEGEVIHLKRKDGISHVKKMDVQLYHFSLKSLNTALDFLISKKNQTPQSKITKNKDNEKNKDE